MGEHRSTLDYILRRLLHRSDAPVEVEAVHPSRTLARREEEAHPSQSLVHQGEAVAMMVAGDQDRAGTVGRGHHGRNRHLDDLPDGLHVGPGRLARS